MKVTITENPAQHLFEVRDRKSNRVLAVFAALWQVSGYCFREKMEVVYA